MKLWKIEKYCFQVWNKMEWLKKLTGHCIIRVILTADAKLAQILLNCSDARLLLWYTQPTFLHQFEIVETTACHIQSFLALPNLKTNSKTWRTDWAIGTSLPNHLKALPNRWRDYTMNEDMINWLNLTLTHNTIYPTNK